MDYEEGMENLKVKRSACFLTPLKKQDMNNRDFFLLDDLQYYSKILKDVIVVPKGFVCDGTSDLLKDDSEPCGVVHDDCYRAPDHKIDILRNGLKVKIFIAKSTADRIFLESMAVWRVPLWKRWMKYLGVVIGGAESYRTGAKRYKIVIWDGVDRRKEKR
jgi:hypothetical protein